MMSIQRFRDLGVMVADNEHGWWVWYEDHVQAVAEAEARILDSYVVRASSWEQGRDAERTRIKELIIGMTGRDNPYSDGTVWLHADRLLSIIDGGPHQHGPGSDPTCAACRANGCAYCGSGKHVAKECPDA